MKKIAFLLLAILLLPAAHALAGGASLSATSAPLADGTAFPDLSLSGELTPEQAAYLGVKGNGPYSLNAIKAPVLIVEIFSMYCPFCQAEAPVVNGLYQLIGQNDLDDKVKLIGVGAGNSDFEVDVFKKKYEVNFPLFSDLDFVAHKAAGEVGTPFFYALRKNASGGYDVVMSSLGRMDSPETFLAAVRKAAKI